MTEAQIAAAERAGEVWEAPARAANQLSIAAHDLFCAGLSVTRVLPDGTVEHVDPAEVFLPQPPVVAPTWGAVVRAASSWPPSANPRGAHVAPCCISTARAASSWSCWTSSLWRCGMAEPTN